MRSVYIVWLISYTQETLIRKGQKPLPSYVGEQLMGAVLSASSSIGQRSSDVLN